MERTSQSRFIAAKVHVIGYIFGMFKQSVQEMEDQESEETRLLATVCMLYGLWQIEEQQGYFLKCVCDCPTVPMILTNLQMAISMLHRLTKFKRG